MKKWRLHYCPSSLLLFFMEKHAFTCSRPCCQLRNNIILCKQRAKWHWLYFLGKSWKVYGNRYSSFKSYLKRPIHTGDDTMLWPVLIIKLTVKRKVGSCLNISVNSNKVTLFEVPGFKCCEKERKSSWLLLQSAQAGEVCHLDLIALIVLLRVTNLHQQTNFTCVSQNHIS